MQFIDEGFGKVRSEPEHAEQLLRFGILQCFRQVIVGVLGERIRVQVGYQIFAQTDIGVIAVLFIENADRYMKNFFV